MKKLIITKATWALLISGSVMLGACQNSNTSSTGQKTDTTTSLFSWFGNKADNTRAMTTPATLTPDPNTVAANTTTTSTNTTTITTETTTDRNGCVVAQKPASHRMAYVHRHRSVRKSHKMTTRTEENVAITEPIGLPVAHDEEIVNVEPKEQPAIETQTEYTGNIPATAPVVKKIRMVHFAPEVGGNLNNLYRLSNDYQTSNLPRGGFHAGIMMNIRLGDRWSLEPGLRYIMKGSLTNSSYSDPISATSFEEREKLTFHYIELPLNLIYNSLDRETGHFMIGAGPYISYLANAQDKTKITKTTSDGTSVTEGQHSLSIGDPNTYGNVRSFDAGLGGFIGYQMHSGVYVKAGGEMGLLDLQKNTHSLGNFYDRNYNFLLSLGYMIGYNK